MEALAGLPLEFNDFSGGMTDNFFQGDKRRYLSAANFDITIDKQLQSRDGTIIYDSIGYSLSGISPTNRITSLHTVLNESVLLGVDSRNFYVQYIAGQAWTAIAGVAGHEALSIGGPFSQVTSGEFQKQFYFTSDAHAQPGKIYLDNTNTWVAKTAGLPKMKGLSNYSNSALLSKCIALANSLRTSFINHINDWSGLPTDPGNTWTSPTIQHKWQDLYSLSYFQTVSFSGVYAYRYNLYLTVYGSSTTLAAAYANSFIPSPIPTPAPAATDEASLYALCTALGLAYANHKLDLGGDPSTNNIGRFLYHQANTFNGAYGPIGIVAALSAKQNPATLRDAAAFLDDFFTKHYWHMLAPYGHSNENNYSAMSRYLVASTYKVGTVTTGEPLVIPNLAPFIDMSMYLQKAFTDHTQNALGAGYQHYQRDPHGNITLPYATDYDSACLAIFWCRYLYYFHSGYSNLTAITFTASAGSTSLTAVVNATTGVSVTIPVGSWIGGWTAAYGGPSFTAANSLDAFAAKVTASGSETATIDRAAVAAATAGNLGQYSAQLHGAWVNGAQVTTTTTAKPTPTSQVFAGGAQAQNKIGTTLQTWLDLAQEFTFVFGAHSNDGFTHKNSYVIGNNFAGSSSLPLINGNNFYIPTAASYVYSFFYADEYTVQEDGIEYLTRGNPISSQQVLTMASLPVGTVVETLDSTIYFDATIGYQRAAATISYMTPLTNDSSTNYDTSNVTEEIYRTTSGGTVGYLLSSSANGTTTYIDSTNDTLSTTSAGALTSGKPLYTNGGTLGSDQPPRCKFVHFLNGYMYYGAVLDTNGTPLDNRLMQATQYAPDAVPALNFVDLDDVLTGVSSARNVPVAFCKNSLYRIEGNFDSTGKGFLSPQKISDEIGCINAKSIVKTEIGTFFAGSDGFYYTDGYQLIKISIDLNKTYLSLTKLDSQKNRVFGTYDKLTRRIFWAMQSNPTSAVNDIFFIFYLDYGVKPSGVFTTSTSQFLLSWAPASCAFYKGNLVIGDEQGYLFKTDFYTKTDPKISFGVDPSTWSTLYIPYDFKSCALDMGTIYKRKWITQIHLAGLNVGDVALQPQSIQDNNETGSGIQNLIPLQYFSNFLWGDPNFYWGDPDFKWKYDGDLDAKRRFPAGSMRSDFRQFRFYPADITVYRSDSYPLGCFANVNATFKTATILTPSGYTAIIWPLDVMDMRICFNTDEYVTEFTISSLDVTGTIITFLDPDNLSTTLSNCKWEIRGVKKEQRLRISSFVVHYGYLGDDVANVTGPSDRGGVGNNS